MAPRSDPAGRVDAALPTVVDAPHAAASAPAPDGQCPAEELPAVERPVATHWMLPHLRPPGLDAPTCAPERCTK